MIASNSVQQSFFSFCDFIMEEIKKVYSAAYHSNPLFMENMELAVKFLFYVIRSNQSIKLFYRGPMT